MNRFFQTLCLILAIGWLPLTQHCRLEAMGIAAQHCEHTGNECCATDNCSTLEVGSYKLGVGKIAVTAPKLVEPLFILALPVAPQPIESLFVEFRSVEHARPLDWVPAWMFVRRAAPPSRAPSVSLA